MVVLRTFDFLVSAVTVAFFPVSSLILKMYCNCSHQNDCIYCLLFAVDNIFPSLYSSRE